MEKQAGGNSIMLLLLPHPQPADLRSPHCSKPPTLDATILLWHMMPITDLLKGIAMPTRNVVLTDYQAALVEQLVASGRYQNASEDLRDGLRLIESREAEDKAGLKALREVAALASPIWNEAAFAASPRRLRSAAT